MYLDMPRQRHIDDNIVRNVDDENGSTPHQFGMDIMLKVRAEEECTKI